jgi:hypothetical protein
MAWRSIRFDPPPCALVGRCLAQTWHCATMIAPMPGSCKLPWLAGALQFWGESAATRIQALRSELGGIRLKPRLPQIGVAGFQGSIGQRGSAPYAHLDSAWYATSRRRRTTGSSICSNSVGEAYGWTRSRGQTCESQGGHGPTWLIWEARTLALLAGPRRTVPPTHLPRRG